MKRLILLLTIVIFIPISVHAESGYLYDVLKNEAESNGLAREYTGAHKDSFTKEANSKIYHWYADNNTDGNSVLEKNNVIFADHCWQILRTTDVGGVKMIYNGEAENGQCLNTRGKHAGYNSNYSNVTLQPAYYYGTDYSYDKSSKKFTLSGNVTTGEVKLNNYTCKLTNQNGSCSVLNYIYEFVEDNKYNVMLLNSESHYSQFGKSPFNLQQSFGNFGYMNNFIYKNKSYGSKPFEIRKYITAPRDNPFYFSNEIRWDETTQKYQLVNPFLSTFSSSGSALNGKYTLRSNDSTFSKSTAEYIVSASTGGSYEYVLLENGKTLNESTDTFTYGDSFIDNGDGSYTIVNPNTFTNVTLYYPDLSYKYMCKNAINNTCNDLRYVLQETDSYDHNLNTFIVSNKYLYFDDYLFEDGKYKASGNSTLIWNLYDYAENKNLKYTCLNETGICDTLAYVYDLVDNNSYYNYIELSNGKDIKEAIDEMLHGTDEETVNINNSIIKIATDAWYEHSLVDYNYYLDDVIYCNNRTYSNFEESRFNRNIISSINLQFNYDNLDCVDVRDSFSISNNDALLKYKVGLATIQELNIVNNNNIRKTGQKYWTLSSRSFRLGFAEISDFGTSGSLSYDSSSGNNGLRPVIALKPTIKYLSGDGSTSNPYVLDYTKYFSINVEFKNETKDINIAIDDLTRVQSGEETKFSVVPIKGYMINSIRIVKSDGEEISYTKSNDNYTFIMPEDDVTIIPNYERVSSIVSIEDDSNTKEIEIEVNDVSAVVYEDRVRFTVIPEDGYEVESIIITDKNNNKVEYRKTENDNEYEFIMPDSDVTIKPVYRKIDTIDVPSTGKNTSYLYLLISILLVGITSYICNSINREDNT